jgi:uncharacterized membrane protein YvbJ
MAGMYDCPHCGEPLEEDASSCPYCGSDSETGWKPDVDYYSLELPEDDEEDGAAPEVRPLSPPERVWTYRIGLAVVTVALIVFVLLGFQTYHWGVLLPLLFLAACAVWAQLTSSRNARGPS